MFDATSQSSKYHRPHYLASRGATIGWRVALIASELYTIAFIFYMMVSTSYSQPNFSQIGVGFLTFAVAQVVGVFPSVLIGVLTGTTLGALIERLYPYLSREFACLLGFAVCSMVGVMFLAILYVRADLSGIFFYAIPTLIYTVLGGIMSWCLYATVQGELG